MDPHLCSSIPLFSKIVVPREPVPASIDLYKTLMTIPEGSTILLESDWTLSTRGESGPKPTRSCGY